MCALYGKMYLRRNLSNIQLNHNLIYDIINKRSDFMNNPVLVIEDDFSHAWAKAIIELSDNSWDAWNFVVTINNPSITNNDAISMLTKFAESKGLITPSRVQHTIFPSRYYKEDKIKNREKLYKYYNRFYSLTRHQPHSGWGTYFKRMISYKTQDGEMYDQLGNIIDHINNRKNNFGAAHFMVIPQIGAESNRKMGSPCLNYVTIQVEKNEEDRIINLLAVYRNHDYRERTFGNYWGLCDLLKYICKETDSSVGSVTCISSHAYVPNNKTELLKIAREILGE